MAARKPTQAEAELLGVYQDAEAAVLDQITRTSRGLLDAAEQGADINALDTARAQGVTGIRAAVARVVHRLDAGAPELIDGVLAAAYEQGSAAGAAQLAAITGRGRDQYGDVVPRGALDRLAAAVLDRVTPAHAAILRTALDGFRQVAQRVVPGVLVGADTRRAATQRALWQLTDRGISGFTDVTGRRWSLSAYAEMAVRTAAARAHEDAKHDRIASAGIGLVIVQGSGDRCPICRPWSGAILALTGSGRRTVTVEHATRDGVMLDVEVAGSVDDARAAGVFHPQCRCSTAAYLPGITRQPPPAVDDGQYEARQRQRAIERQIRAGKARQAAALDEPAARRAAMQVRAAQARMREHLDANPDLLRRRYREQVGTGNLPTGRTAGPMPERVDTVPPAPRMTAAQLEQHYRDTVGDVPERERRALFNYTGGEFVGVNGWLRGNALVPPRDPASPFLDFAKPAADALTSLAKRYNLPEDARVYRMVNADALPDGLKVGKTFTERGFTSTSFDRASTVEFRNRPVELTIDVPAGHRAIVVNGLAKGVQAESELILPTGTRFEVLADETGPDGVRRMRLAALPGRNTAVAAPKVRTARDLSDAELDAAMQEAIGADDMDRFDRLAQEADRRDAAKASRRERDAARRAARDEARAVELERLLDAGHDEEEAVAQVYGQSVEKQRRAAAMGQLRAAGYRGKSFDEMSRASWKDTAYARYDEAEAATNGYMLNDAGRRAGFTESALFTAPESQVRKYASPEMLEWFDRNGRETLTEHRAMLLGDSQAAYRLRNERGDFYT